MEDSARLALIEMYVNNDNVFENLLKELLLLINHILDNPHDSEIRKLKSDVFKPLLKCEDFCAYLKYIGFELQGDTYAFPQEQTLSKLKFARAAIEKKIIYCYGPEKCTFTRATVRSRKKSGQLTPANVLTTDNQFLQSIQTSFNDMLKYEDEELQEFAHENIPLVQLQLRALERMREYQKKIKTGEVAGEDMTFEMALLAELVSWFKHQFFTWVDSPPCTLCGGATRFSSKTVRVVEGETCRVEEYQCTACLIGTATFPRHKDPRVLLRTRRGRCGEYANCFALLCRTLGYDTRYVFDTADHVWCEVFDYDSSKWVHADPCEAKLNAPLMYSHGWNKRLSYVIAVSRDDLQDVTWRYTSQHNEVLSRRTLCTESELLNAILELRSHRQAQISTSRRRYLAERALRELVQLQVEKTPEDYESEGRLSGSLAWRQKRGEEGTNAKGYVFEFEEPGNHAIRYYTSTDEYKISLEDQENGKLVSWTSGALECRYMFRKVETDWKQVYLAREEGEKTGWISWKVTSISKHQTFRRLSIRAQTAVFEAGVVEWTLKFDDHEPKIVRLGEYPAQHICSRRFNTVVVTAQVSGGVGDTAWQHAQLFRQPLNSDAPTFEIQAHMDGDDDIDLD